MSMDALLKDITASIEDTAAAVRSIALNEDVPELVQELKKKVGMEKLETVSLLDLKNSSLVAYLNSLAIIILGFVNRIDGKTDPAKLQKAIEKSIVHRVTLEKGVKPLEKKLTYQLDKMVRTYTKMIDEEKKAEEKQPEAGLNSAEESDDELNYRPDASSLAAEKETTSKGKYRAPRISAMAPPKKNESSGPTKKLQSMEEYLKESSDMPEVDVSIGSSFRDSGRGGIKTARERQKEREVQNYEEDNFIRLPSTQTKKTLKQRRHDMENVFGGEDFSMFSNSRSFSEPKRRKKTAWDNVKKQL